MFSPVPGVFLVCMSERGKGEITSLHFLILPPQILLQNVENRTKNLMSEERSREGMFFKGILNITYQ